MALDNFTELSRFRHLYYYRSYEKYSKNCPFYRIFLNKYDTNSNEVNNIGIGLNKEEELHPSLLLHVQYSMKMLYVPVLIRQNLSSPWIPTSPKYAQPLK